MKNSPYLDKPLVPRCGPCWPRPRQRSRRQRPPKKPGSKRGPRCCASGLPRDQLSRSEPNCAPANCAPGRIGDPGSAQPPAALARLTVLQIGPPSLREPSCVRSGDAIGLPDAA